MPHPTLMYHGLWPAEDNLDRLRRFWAADPQFRDPGARLYALDQRVFEAHLDLLLEHRRATPADWPAPGTELAPNDVLITFDDGHASNHSLAMPALRRRGLTGIFFITTDWIGTAGFMSEPMLRDLHEAGMLLGTHGCSHRYFSDLPEDDLRRELTESKARLEGVLGCEVPALSLPGGRNHRRIRRLASEAGYRLVFTSEIALAPSRPDPMDWPRIALTHIQGPELIEALARGDDAPVRAMARSAAVRKAARRLMGNRAYDALRAALIRRRGGTD